jgi:hypothetical protein
MKTPPVSSFGPFQGMQSAEGICLQRDKQQIPA